MANVISRDDAVKSLAAQAEVIGHLAQDGGAFAAVVAAFEAKDADAFRWVLNRVEMLPYCELICEWVRIKLGVLRCIELCGVPRDRIQVPGMCCNFGELAGLVASRDPLNGTSTGDLQVAADRTCPDSLCSALVPSVLGVASGCGGAS